MEKEVEKYRDHKDGEVQYISEEKPGEHGELHTSMKMPDVRLAYGGRPVFPQRRIESESPAVRLSQVNLCLR